jgi:hypothetical protein
VTKQQIEVLRNEVESMAAAGAGRGEFREWAEAYYFCIEDLYEVVKLLVDELDDYRLAAEERGGQERSGNGHAADGKG